MNKKLIKSCFKCPYLKNCKYFNDLIIFTKKLTRGEKKENIIRVPKKVSKSIPWASEIVVHFKNEKVGLKIDAYGRMNPIFMLWSTFIDAINFNPHSDIIAFKWKTPEKKIIEIGVVHETVSSLC